MTAQHDLDLRLGTWFGAEAAPPPPPEPLARILEATRIRRPRAALVASIGSQWVSDSPSSALRRTAGGRRVAVITLVALVALALIAGAILVGDRQAVPKRTYVDEVVPAADMAQDYSHPVVVPLTDGRVLVIGAGSDGDGHPTTALVYDPSTGASMPAGPFASQPDPTWISAAVRLPDGHVFVTGNGSPQVFDPRTLQFTAVGPMVADRTDPALALLHDGRVLIAGGRDSTDEWLLSAELFDPATRTFSSTGSMSSVGTASAWEAIATLPDGRVFLGESAVTLYDPMTGTFSTHGRNDAFRDWRVIVTQDGRVVVLGRSGIGTRTGHAATWDAASGAFTEVLTNAPGYTIDRAALLDDGRILVMGGNAGLRWAGAFDLKTGTIKKIDPSKAWWPTVTRLDDGRVLFVGGVNDWNLRLCPTLGCVSAPAVKTVQIFQ
jgi:hypothetical protein